MAVSGSAVAAAPTPNQLVQLSGAALILLAYLFLQLGKTGPRRSPYLAANCIGAGLLAAMTSRPSYTPTLVGA